MEYNRLVETYEFLESESGRLQKVAAIARLFSETSSVLLPKVVTLIQGRIFPPWDEHELGIANLLMEKIIASSTGYSREEVNRVFNKIGDYGLVVERLSSGKKQRTLISKKLTVEKVFENLRSVALMEGKGSQEKKFALVSELFAMANPKEAKYISRTTLGILRVGVAEGVVRDGIAKAFFADPVWNEDTMAEIAGGKSLKIAADKKVLKKLEGRKLTEKELKRFEQENMVVEKDAEGIRKMNPWKGKTGFDYIFADEEVGNEIKKNIISAIEWGWFLRSDYGEIATTAKEEGLEGLRNIRLTVGKPYHVLLAEKCPSLEEGLKTFEHPGLEFKYDGARVIIQKKGKMIKLFTRNLEDITKQFPDAVSQIQKAVKADSFIVEGEMLGINPKNNHPLPFQMLSQRIKRKYDIEKLVKEIPINILLFDITYYMGETLFQKPFSERRKLLESIVNETVIVRLSKLLITRDLKTAENFYKQALGEKQEGVMIKNMDAVYHPGRRVGYWLKVKPVLENLDLALVGAQWGTGKRAGLLGSFILGCRDPSTGDFLECGMLGTGLKEKKTQKEDVTLGSMTKLLKPYIIKEAGGGVRIKPKVVVEVSYEEVQKSPTYSSGFALRFPRFVSLRVDKPVSEADTIERVKYLYGIQKGRGKK